MLGNYIDEWILVLEDKNKKHKIYKTEKGAKKAFKEYEGSCTLYQDTNVVNQSIRIDYK